MSWGRGEVGVGFEMLWGAWESMVMVLSVRLSLLECDFGCGNGLTCCGTFAFRHELMYNKQGTYKWACHG